MAPLRKEDQSTELADLNGGKKNGKNGDDKKEEKSKTRQRHHSRESEVSIESMEEYIPTPPDGGWGWVIVLASLVANLIVDGISYSFGVFLLEFVDAFDAPKSKVALVGSLLSGIYLFAGPIVSAMTNKFGCRPVVIVGSCISTLGFALASLSPSVEILILTYGVIGGFGLGMIYLPSIVSVGYYFEKKRAFATGLAVCGSGIGTFMFPPLSEFLLEKYAWQGGLLIIAGIVFQGCICGVLMRPLQAKPIKSSKKPRAKNLMDRIKETTQRDRAISECSAMTKKAAVMVAKLEREKTLQDNDSDLGSLPSVAFMKRGDSLSQGDHHRLSLEPRRHKASVCSTVTSDSVDTSARESAAGTSTQTSPSRTVPEAIVKKSIDESNPESRQISPEPESDGKMSEGGEGASSDPSEYFTPPDTAENSPVKSPSSVVPDSTGQEDKKETEGEAGGDNSNQTGNGNLVAENGNNGNSPLKVDPNNIESLDQIKTTAQFMHEFAPLLEVPAPRIHNGAAKGGGHGGSRTNMTHLLSVRSLHVSKKDLARPLYRKDIFYSGSVLNIPQFQSQPDMKSYITSITTIPGEMEIVDGPSPSSKVINSICSCLPRPARDILSEMVDVSLLKDVSFMLICLGNISAFLGFFIPFVYIVDRAVSLGVDKSQAAFLISIIGITNTVGRVLVGKLADLRIIDSLVITYLSIALCGLVTILIPFCDTYPLLATAGAVFGLGVAAFISLSSIIICDRMGLEKLTNAFGLLSMVRGLAGMVGSPLAGFMYDSTGSYSLSFFLGGILLFIGAGCHLFLHLPCLRPKKNPGEFMADEMIGEALGLGSRPQLLTVEEISGDGKIDDMA